MNNNIKVNYYDTFRCLANACEYTCCQEWSITVDEQTADKWKSLKLDEVTLEDYLEEEESKQIITLDEEKKCPFLSCQGLCRVVVELGEENITQICMSYPRHINKFKDRTEYALDFGCPAVIDLLNEKGSGIDSEQELEDGYMPSVLYGVREMILDIIQDTEYSLTERMMMIFNCLLELLEEESVTEDVVSGYRDRDYLDALVGEIRKVELDTLESFWERNIIFLDMIQIYRQQDNYVEYIEEIAKWAERLEEYYSDSNLLEKIQAFNQEYIKYEKLLNDYLAAEIFASCLTEEMELEGLVMVFQWIVLEYSAIKQALFMKWLSEDEGALTYHTVRDYMMIMSRMAGYGQNEIKQNLEYSFETAILEWGHIALIIGNSIL